jgi:hypothetical protein
MTGLMAGGSVFMLLAHRRGMESIDPRWEQLARRMASWIFNLIFSGLALAGVSLWLVFIFVHPRAVAHLHRIFSGALFPGLVLLLIGVVCLALYYFRWESWRESSTRHFQLGLVATVCLWLAAAIPVSVKSFMLTSGNWPTSGALWRAVFNPSFIPAFYLWAAISLIVAGIAGLLFAMRQKDDLWRNAIVQGVGAVTAGAALAASVACLAWLFVLSIAGNLDGFGNEVPPVYFGAGAAIIAVELSVLLVLTAVRKPQGFGKVLCSVAVVSVVIILVGVQWVQEKSQGAYLIHKYMYRNGILVSEVERLKEGGLWKPAAWMPEAKETPQGGALGAFSFKVQCRSCHAVWEKADSSAGMPAFEFEGDALLYLDKIDSHHPYFPLFAGSNDEKLEVAAYLESLVKKSGVSLASRPVGPPADAAKGKPSVSKPPQAKDSAAGAPTSAPEAKSDSPLSGPKEKMEVKVPPKGSDSTVPSATPSTPKEATPNENAKIPEQGKKDESDTPSGGEPKKRVSEPPKVEKPKDSSQNVSGGPPSQQKEPVLSEADKKEGSTSKTPASGSGTKTPASETQQEKQ